MRRLFTLAAVIGLLFVMAAPAAAGPKGELTSAFHNEINQFNTNGAVDVDRPEGHITPFTGPGPVLICDDLVVGTWSSLFDSDKDVLDTITTDIRLDGELLVAAQTPTRQRTFQGESIWSYTRGVPVIGTLDAGDNVLEDESFEAGQNPFVASVDIVVSSC